LLSLLLLRNSFFTKFAVVFELMFEPDFEIAGLFDFVLVGVL
jgi:hypothetical protein